MRYAISHIFWNHGIFSAFYIYFVRLQPRTNQKHIYICILWFNIFPCNGGNIFLFFIFDFYIISSDLPDTPCCLVLHRYYIYSYAASCCYVITKWDRNTWLLRVPRRRKNFAPWDVELRAPTLWLNAAKYNPAEREIEDQNKK